MKREQIERNSLKHNSQVTQEKDSRGIGIIIPSDCVQPRIGMRKKIAERSKRDCIGVTLLRGYDDVFRGLLVPLLLLKQEQVYCSLSMSLRTSSLLD
jgi:hypothetical protein